MKGVMPAKQRQLFNANAKIRNVLPIKVTPHYEKLVREEYEVLGRSGGPLYRAVYPDADRLELHDPHEVPDFVEDRINMPRGLENVLIHKYRCRALFLVTDKCTGHCMYCFRQDVLTDIHGNPLPSLEERVSSVVDYLRVHSEISELILSGGDPLNIPFRHLKYLFEQLVSKTGVRNIRVHSRNLVFAPQIISD